MLPNDHDHLSPAAQEVVRLAHLCALRLNHRQVCTEHLLLGLIEMDDPVVTAILTNLDVIPKKLRKNIEFVIGRGRTTPQETELSHLAVAALREAWREAKAMRAEAVRPEHLLLGLLCERQGLASGMLENFQVTYDRVRVQSIQVANQGAQRTAYAMEHSLRYQQTPTLNMVSRDLTAAALAGNLDPLIGREEELERTMQVLARRTKNNPVLIGPAGVGKTAIAEGLAYRIVQGQVPENLLNQRVVALDVGLLTIGTKYRGDFEERLKRILAEIVAAHNLIIVVDELHTLIGAGVAEGSVDAANLLKPILARGDFRCMGTTTLDDYRKTIERDPALERRFQPVLVRETTADETLEILHGLKERYEAFHHVTFTPEALRAAVTLSARYVQDRQLPDKAIDLVDEAAARMCVGRSVLPAQVRSLRERLAMLRDDKDNAIDSGDFALARSLWQEEGRLREELDAAEDAWRTWHESAAAPVVTEHEIAVVVAAWTGVPAVKLDSEEATRLLKLEEVLHQRIIGQAEAVSAIARAIRRNRAELRDPRRPIGSFVFVGPTGVGKTELAKAVAEALFDDEDALIAFDMSEFQEAHYAARLVGAPPGYVGYDQAGKLTEAVRRRPYSVVLFDEIEKAHPRIFDLLLQILEDGHISDAKGRTVDFRNTVVILTSNAGMQYLTTRGTMGFAHGDEDARRTEWMQQQVMTALREVFRPEMLNRLDEIVVFAPLDPAQMRQIVDLLVARVEQRLAEQHLTLRLSEAARDYITQHGFSREYGARPLRRALQTLLEDPLAEGVLRGEYHPGDTIVVDVHADALALRAATPVPSLPKAS
jgi:ATP-dependent Clp protease ATP-binding subunit ClpC